jgi:integrase
MEEIRNAKLYGVRLRRTWREAGAKYLKEATKSSIGRDADILEALDPFIGDLPLTAVHMGTLQPFIENRRNGFMRDDKLVLWKMRTINYALQTVRHILNLAAGEWMDEHGLTWLEHAPKIKLLREDDKREPHPLSWDEQERLFAALPGYLRNMAVFKVNTGCREQEVCRLRWEWEEQVPQLNTSVFIIPKFFDEAKRHGVKNREDRLVVLNSLAREVIEGQRGIHPEYVFLNSRGRPVRRMCREAWRAARKKAKLLHVRVHDLKHTYGRRLRAAGVSFEDRQDLLGHKSARITTHYSAPELLNLIQASERICQDSRHKSDTLVILRKKRAELRLVNSA